MSSIVRNMSSLGADLHRSLVLSELPPVVCPFLFVSFIVRSSSRAWWLAVLSKDEAGFTCMCEVKLAVGLCQTPKMHSAVDIQHVSCVHNAVCTAVRTEHCPHLA